MWVRFEPTTTEFCWDAVTDWAIRPLISTCSQSQLCRDTQVSSLSSVFTFYFVHCFAIYRILFKRGLAQVITFVAERIGIHGIHHWRIFRSSYRKLAWVGFEPMTTLNSVRRSKRQSYHTMSLTRSQSQLCAVTPISSLCSEFIFHFGLCLRQLPHLPQVNSRTGNHVSSGMNWCIWYSLLKDF